jgi:hypothetical protein
LPTSARRFVVANVLGPFGAWWLRDRVDGVVGIHTGHQVRDAEVRDGRVRLVVEDAAHERHPVEVDHVVCGTGYRPDLDQIGVLDPALRAAIDRVGTSARLSRRFESSVPGWYFAGLSAASSFGPVLRFVYGAHFTAQRIAAALPARLPADRVGNRAASGRRRRGQAARTGRVRANTSVNSSVKAGSSGVARSS